MFLHMRILFLTPHPSGVTEGRQERLGDGAGPRTHRGSNFLLSRLVVKASSGTSLNTRPAVFQKSQAVGRVFSSPKKGT